jgi:hypothetical protein
MPTLDAGHFAESIKVEIAAAAAGAGFEREHGCSPL